MKVQKFRVEKRLDFLQPYSSGMKICMVEQRTAEPQNAQPQNFQGWFRLAHAFFRIIDGMHSFDI
ncbi:MAG: hypothetical protein P8X68_08310 [Desulfobacterales bacterium]|jgi:hypothetical protein